jgi:hypothetical protein
MMATDGYYAEARRVAEVFQHVVGIYPTGCDDGRFRHWEWRGPDAAGQLVPGYIDVVYPNDSLPAP